MSPTLIDNLPVKRNGSRMKPLDAVWLMMESPETPMHVGVLAIFEKPEDAPEDYLSDMAGKMRESREPVAPWNLRLAAGRGSTISPRMVAVRDFDLEYHFRYCALPGAGGERELGIMVSRLHSHALDRDRPLWEFHLIEGLERGRFAFYVKVHHALVDAVNGIPMLLSVLSDSAVRRNMQPLWSQPLGGGEDTGALAAGNDAEADKQLGAAFDPRASVASVGKVAYGLLRGALKPGGAGSFLRTRGTPYSTLNRRINAQRRFATQRFEQARIERLAEATEATLVEMLIYLCGSSLRRFFKEYNALPDQSLVGLMPVSLQERGERLSGNAIVANRVALGTHLGDPLARLAAVKASVQAVLTERASMPEQGSTSFILMRSAPVYASQLPGVEHFIPPLFNVRVSHTLGSPDPLYFNGARMESVYPMSHLMQCSALSIDMVNYAGMLNIGFTGARDTLPHLQRMAVYFGKALSDLEELVYPAEALSGEGLVESGADAPAAKRSVKRVPSKTPPKDMVDDVTENGQ
jgi:diacylglycerol O-acyltransferase